jgi:hypothetical protein
LVLGEESDNENSTDDKWAEHQDGNWYIPPMNVFIQKAVENLDEQSECDEQGQNTNCDQTAFDWEASTA